MVEKWTMQQTSEDVMTLLQKAASPPELLRIRKIVGGPATEKKGAVSGLGTMKYWANFPIWTGFYFIRNTGKAVQKCAADGRTYRICLPGIAGITGRIDCCLMEGAFI